MTYSEQQGAQEKQTTYIKALEKTVDELRKEVAALEKVIADLEEEL